MTQDGSQTQGAGVAHGELERYKSWGAYRRDICRKARDCYVPGSVSVKQGRPGIFGMLMGKWVEDIIDVWYIDIDPKRQKKREQDHKQRQEQQRLRQQQEQGGWQQV